MEYTCSPNESAIEMENLFADFILINLKCLGLKTTLENTFTTFVIIYQFNSDKTLQF